MTKLSATYLTVQLCNFRQVEIHAGVNLYLSTELWCCHRGRAIARVHPVHLMNAEQRQAAADPRPSQTT